jgi:hypothetical protein
MCEGDCPDCSNCTCDMATLLTVCFCFKLCCDVSQDTSRGGMSTSNEDEEPLNKSPVNTEMSRFKF